MFNTLKSRKDFLRIRDYGLKSVCKGLILQAAPNNDYVLKRFGFTASRKIGNAVTRNRAKRRLRALVQINYKEQFNNGMDYVLIARNETAKRDFHKLNQELLFAINYVSKKLN